MAENMPNATPNQTVSACTDTIFEKRLTEECQATDTFAPAAVNLKDDWECSKEKIQSSVLEVSAALNRVGWEMIRRIKRACVPINDGDKN